MHFQSILKKVFAVTSILSAHSKHPLHKLFLALLEKRNIFLVKLETIFYTCPNHLVKIQITAKIQVTANKEFFKNGFIIYKIGAT